MNVNIDISNPIDRYALTQREGILLADYVIGNIASKYVDMVKAEAAIKLHGTRRDYIDGIMVDKIRDGKYSVSLIGFLPNAIEYGLSPFDMKAGFMASNKRTLKAGGGWFLTIPLRHATPEAVATSGIFADKMPAEVYEIAKRLVGGGSIARGMLPDTYSTAGARPIVVGARVFEEYKHKSPMYQGMVKTGGAKHSQYYTFRRVSDNSDPDSWIHTGIKKYAIAQESLRCMNFGFEVKRSVDTFLTMIGK